MEPRQVGSYGQHRCTALLNLRVLLVFLAERGRYDRRELQLVECHVHRYSPHQRGRLHGARSSRVQGTSCVLGSMEGEIDPVFSINVIYRDRTQLTSKCYTFNRAIDIDDKQSRFHTSCMDPTHIRRRRTRYRAHERGLIRMFRGSFSHKKNIFWRSIQSLLSDCTSRRSKSNNIEASDMRISIHARLYCLSALRILVATRYCTTYFMPMQFRNPMLKGLSTDLQSSWNSAGGCFSQRSGRNSAGR